FDPHVAERDAVRSARDAADRLSVQDELVSPLDGVDLQQSQLAVDLSTVVLARDRLLARIATLGEADVRLLEAGLLGKDQFVEFLPPARNAGLDAPARERFFARRLAGRPLVEHLLPPDHEPRLMLFRLDLDLRRKARTQ